MVVCGALCPYCFQLTYCGLYLIVIKPSLICYTYTLFVLHVIYRFTLMLAVKEAKWVTYYSVYIVLVNTHIAR